MASETRFVACTMDFRKGTLALRSPSGAQVDQFRPDLVANQIFGNSPSTHQLKRKRANYNVLEVRQIIFAFFAALKVRS